MLNVSCGDKVCVTNNRDSSTQSTYIILGRHVTPYTHSRVGEYGRGCTSTVYLYIYLYNIIPSSSIVQ